VRTCVELGALMQVGAASVLALARGSRRLLDGDLDPAGDARVSLPVAAPPERVWAVLADGATYGDWVVAANPVRAVDPEWPDVGASLAYSIGIRPLDLQGTTWVLHSDPPRLLELEIDLGTAGSVRVEIGLQAVGTGTRLSLDEHAERGPARWMHNPAASAAYAARAVLMLRRLRALAESP